MYPISSPVSSLYQSGYHLEELLESLNDVLIATDNNFVITKWNKAAELVYGFTAKEAIGINYHKLIHRELLGTTVNNAIREVREYNVWKGISKYTNADGEDSYLESSTSAIKNEDGFVTGYVAIQRNVTQKFLSEQSIQGFSAILHSLDESFLVVNQDLKVVFLSPKKNVIRFDNSDYRMGDDALLYIPEHEKAGVVANYKKAFAGEVVIHEAHSGGNEETRIYLHVTYMPLKNSFDIIGNVVVIVKDLTDEKRRERLELRQREAEAQLYKSRMLFEKFMENCPLPAWITDESGVMHYMNPTYIDNIQVSKEDIGKNITDIFPKIIANDYHANNMQVLENNKAVTVVEKGIGSDGNMITFLINKFPLYEGSTRMVAGWAMNITEQVKMQSELEEANKGKNKVLAVIGHDLRSPLTVINGIGRILCDDAGSISGEERGELAQAIMDSSRKAMTLLADLTLWGQSQADRIAYLPQQLNMAEVIADAASFYNKELLNKELSVLRYLENDVDVYADKEMVKTVMRNLLSNAIKFSPAGGNICIYTASDEQAMNISISDEGKGIGEELRNRILKGTNNTSTFGTSGEKGIGLGLSLSKDFIEKNNGVMTIRNNKTKGATFSFSLPVWKEALIE